MKKLKYLLFLSPFFIMAGCDDYYMIGSLNPFYTDENIVLLPEIEGDWVAKPYKDESNNSNQIWKKADSTLTWSIKRKLNDDKKPTNVYSVQLGENKPDSVFIGFSMVVFKLGDEYYADFSPDSNQATENSRLAVETNYPVHTLSKILRINNQLTLSWLGDETMRVMIEDKRVRARFRWIQSSDRFVLTGSPKQLSAMIEKYCSEIRFVEWNKQSAMISLTSVN